MDELAQKLSEIMSNPSAMEKLKGLTAGLFGNNNSSNNDNNNKSEQKSNNFSNILENCNTPNNDNIKLITKLIPMLNAINRDDDSTRLLNALRPFLSNEKQKRLDDAIKLIQTIKILPLIKNSGLLKI